VPPRTIDNLGIDASSRYAADQHNLNTEIVKSSGSIPRQAEIDVTTPSFSSEFDLLFDTGKKNSAWAQFSMPNDYNEQRKRLFTYQITPSLGTPDKVESLEHKILSKLKEPSEDLKKEAHNKPGELKLTDWEQNLEKGDQEREQKVLLQFLKTIHTLDRCVADISSRRMQYQKG